MYQSIIVFFILSLVFFRPALAQSPAGSWEIKQAGITMDLKEDGSGTMNGQAFKWQVSEGTLIVEDNSGLYYYSYLIEGNTLAITDLTTGIILNFTKKPGSGTATAKTEEKPAPKTSGGSIAPELAGKWCYMSNIYASNGGSMTNECITLNENGTYEYYRESSSSGDYGGYASQESDNGTWTVSGNVIHVQSNSKGPASYSFRKQNHPKNGDPMLIIDERAFVTYYSKNPW